MVAVSRSSSVSAAATRIARLPAPARLVTRSVLSTLTLAYRVRYAGRLRCGKDVVILGRLSLARGTRLSLGDRARVRRGVIVNGGGAVRVGSDTLLNGCWIGARTSVTIGDWCLISDCDITDSDYHNLEPHLRHESPGGRTDRPIAIGNNVWIGAHAMLLKGTHVGDDSVVGAGSVVRGAVPEGVVVMGNPATVVKEFNRRQRTRPTSKQLE